MLLSIPLPFQHFPFVYFILLIFHFYAYSMLHLRSYTSLIWRHCHLMHTVSLPILPPLHLIMSPNLLSCFVLFSVMMFYLRVFFPPDHWSLPFLVTPLFLFIYFTAAGLPLHLFPCVAGVRIFSLNLLS